jgi:nucleoside-diphosphate-sugar epimerase
MSKITLTGATGFIGQHFAKEIIASEEELKILSRRKNKLLLDFEKLGARISTLELSDKKGIASELGDCETVIHLAGATKTLTEKEMFKVNVEYTKNLLDVCDGRNIHFVYISSQAAAGPAKNLQNPVKESDSPNPLTWYGKSKLEAENEVKKWGERKNNNYTVIRPPSVFGPGEKDIFSCFKLMNKNLSFSIGYKEKRLSVIYVKDLVSAIMHLSKNIEFSGKTYFASSDDHYSWEELFSAIAQSMNKRKYLKLKLPEFSAVPVAFFSEMMSKITKKPALLNSQKIIEMKQDFWLCSNSLLKSTGWKPKYSIKEAMDETTRWYRENNWL